MKVLFSNCLGDYSYSFRGSSELLCITVTVSLFLAERSCMKEFPSGILKNLLQLQLHNLMVFELKCNDFEKNGNGNGYRARGYRPGTAQSAHVLHGVGADGVGVKFPICAIKCSCLPLSSKRVREKQRKKKKSEEKGKKKKGKFLRPHLY